MLQENSIFLSCDEICLAALGSLAYFSSHVRNFIYFSVIWNTTVL